MKMEKQKFRIGALARHLNLEQFVIRFWEKEFNIEAQRSNGRQRYYTDNDVKKFNIIKDLLYNKKLTIAGAKKFLNENNKKKKAAQYASPATKVVLTHSYTAQQDTPATQQKLQTHMLDLKKRLERLRKLL